MRKTGSHRPYTGTIPFGPDVAEPPAPAPLTDTERAWLNEMQAYRIAAYHARHYGTDLDAEQTRLRAYVAGDKS